VNDNKGTWRSDVQTVVREAQRDGVPGREFARALSPSPDDYVILKPKHSMFLGTPLDLVLESIGAHTVIMAGVTTNSCVLISAGELFVRGYRLVVPRDCVQALTPDAQGHSLRLMEESYKAETELSGDLDLKTLLQPPSD
jgi:nicotinamidase-related amidase